MEGDVSLEAGGGWQALSRKEGLMIEAPVASAESNVPRPQTPDPSGKRGATLTAAPAGPGDPGVPGSPRGP